MHDRFEPKGLVGRVDEFVAYWFDKDCVIDHAGLGAHFDEIVYSAALGVCKPERVFFTNAQVRMGVAVGPCFIAGPTASAGHSQAGAGAAQAHPDDGVHDHVERHQHGRHEGEGQRLHGGGAGGREDLQRRAVA